jgi:hypothetical protein
MHIAKISQSLPPFLLIGDFLKITGTKIMALFIYDDDVVIMENTRCVQDALGLIFFLNFALQCHLLASCGVKILEVSAVAVYNFKAQASLQHVF